MINMILTLALVVAAYSLGYRAGKLDEHRRAVSIIDRGLGPLTAGGHDWL